MTSRATRSAGLLLFRHRGGALEVLLGHPGGPLWAKKDLGAWTIPKGEVHDGEDLVAAARREFLEETGIAASADGLIALTPIRQASGKVVHAWAAAGDVNPAQCASNTFTMEWPPRSGQRQAFPEIDRLAWFPLSEARARILPRQAGLLDELERLLG
ncbi:MAG: NUDIX domain-containing protein [Acidobacteria bacterium]|nr:NUDIX domain-containing protein [Acidobacteriota bacterium]